MRKVSTGVEGLIGQTGEALEDLNPKGKVFVNGEYWMAEAAVKIPEGASVRVTSVRGMILAVEIDR